MSTARRRPRVLFVASEAVPWVKTGGLAEVAGSLPRALAEMNCDVRLLLPAYGDVLAAQPGLKPVAGFRPPVPGAGLLEAPRETVGLRTWLCTLPGISDRPGNPYLDSHGRDWPDNWYRFGTLSQVAAALAAGRAGVRWQADVVHAHDWQAGLVPVMMMLQRVPAASVFTVHNLHYRGLFPHDCLSGLHLPEWLWHYQALEFHGSVSFLKAGLVFADALTTVSPTYAGEICTPEFGEGLDGLLHERRAQLTGILNGIDEGVWDPAHDPHLPEPYDSRHLKGKAACKQALQHDLVLTADLEVPVIGMVARLTPQKGVDLLLAALPGLLARSCQLALLGRGDPALEAELKTAAAANPGRIGVSLTFDETLAHRIEAGADLFLMPSRFEPCGLNQMYSQRYGTPPIVHGVGGLHDSVVHASPEALRAGRASGFVFTPATPQALLDVLDQALALYHRPEAWHTLQLAGMKRDFSWHRRAGQYLDAYESARSPFTVPR